MIKYDYNTYRMNSTIDAIKNAIQESFPMTKVKLYIVDRSTLSVTIRYFCYDEEEMLAITLYDVTHITTDDEFLDNLICEIGDKITQKEAEYAAKRRSTGSN